MPTDQVVPVSGGTITVSVPDPLAGPAGPPGPVGPLAPIVNDLGDKTGVAGQTVTLDWQGAGNAIATLTMPSSGVVGLAHANVVVGASLLLTVKSTGNATISYIDPANAQAGGQRSARAGKPPLTVPAAGGVVFDVLSFVTVRIPLAGFRVDVTPFTKDLA